VVSSAKVVVVVVSVVVVAVVVLVVVWLGVAVVSVWVELATLRCNAIRPWYISSSKALVTRKLSVNVRSDGMLVLLRKCISDTSAAVELGVVVVGYTYRHCISN
jgi:hypothetical protein